jgi:phosphohistidine phosphatase
MKQLLILRHAKSSWDDSSLADHDRPLNPRGSRDAPRMGRLLGRERLGPSLVLCSSALRARTTATMVMEGGGLTGELMILNELYLASPHVYIRLLLEVPEEHETVMVVGHNPGLAELVETLTGHHRPMPTAALARIRLPIERWADLDGMPIADLAGYWKPRSLPDGL